MTPSSSEVAITVDLRGLFGTRRAQGSGARAQTPLGGAAVTEELTRASNIRSALTSSASVPRSFETSTCLTWVRDRPAEASFTLIQTAALCRWPDPARTREEIAKFSAKDADRYVHSGAAMGQLARFSKTFIDNPAPDPASFKPSDLIQL